MINFIHKIGSGPDRSVRVAIHNYLDEWLIFDGNMARWEDNMTAGERIIFMSNFLPKVLIHLMFEYRYELRISALERT